MRRSIFGLWLLNVHGLLCGGSIVRGQTHRRFSSLLCMGLIFQDSRAEEKWVSLMSNEVYRRELTVACDSSLCDAPPDCALLQTILRIECSTILPIQVNLRLLWWIDIEQDVSRRQCQL